MSGDAPTNKQVQEQVAAERADLSVDPGVTVPTGSEEIPTRQDPFEARKALFQKHKGKRQQRVTTERESDPDVAEQSQLIEGAIAGGDTSAPLPRGRGEAPRAPAPAAPAPAPQTEQSSAAPQGASPSAQDRVSVTVNGKTFEVPQRDIDRAGGVDAYQKQRAAAQALAEAGEERRKAAEERAALERERAEWEARQRAGATPPATSPGAPAGQGTTQQGAPGDGASVQKRAEEMAASLYAGDKAKVTKAIENLISAAERNQQPLDAKQIAIEAARILREQAPAAAPAPTPKPAQQPVDPVFEAERRLVNQTIPVEYKDVYESPELRTLALARIGKLRADPANKGRSLLDISRDACDEVREKYGNAGAGSARAAVTERKQGLPPAPGASGKAPGAPTAPAKLDYFEARRKASGRG